MGSAVCDNQITAKYLTMKFRLAGKRNFNWNHDESEKGKQINGN